MFVKNKKGAFYLLKVDLDYQVVLLSVGQFDSSVMFIYGFKENSDDYKNTLFAGMKYYNSQVDLLNSSSWGSIHYNGVKFNVVTVEKQQL